MGFEIRFSRTGEKDLEDLSPEVRQRILKKIVWFIAQDNPLSFSVVLKNSTIGERRFRVGDYRIIVCLDESKKHIVIVAIGHRNTIYQN